MIVYFSSVLLSIGITALPLLTIEPVGLEKSLYLMYFLEFTLSVLIVIFLYKNPWKLGDKGIFIKCLLILFLMQLIISITRDGSIQSVQISISQVLPLFFAVFVVPFYEECIYRGCLVDFLYSIFKTNLIIPVVLTSVIFSAMHTQYSSLLGFTVLFTISLIFSFARFKSGSLLPSMILHSLMNAFVIALNILISK
uniref:CPBP family intramembrane glutamic endopeptidase n=1 Tax=Pantoea sp. IMH TaxID=1267600 RepID=UPI0004691B2F